MPDIDDLLVRIDATTEQLRREMKRADQTVASGSAKIDKRLERVDASFDRIARSAKIAGLAIAGYVAASGTRKLVEVARSTDVMEAQLKTATGSLVAAGIAMSDLTAFAAETPFSLNQVVDAFVKLTNLGLDPSREALISYGNTASAMGKDLNQMIEAVADAATGEFERLKEFGIKASSEGDRVTFTFRGISTTIQKEAAAIEGYLRSIGDVEFGGAMEERANSLDGALSNLEESWEDLFRTISDSGIGALIESQVRQATEALNGLSTGLKTFFPGGVQGDRQALQSELMQLQKTLETLEGQTQNRRGRNRVNTQEKINQLREREVEILNQIKAIDGAIIKAREDAAQKETEKKVVPFRGVVPGMESAFIANTNAHLGKIGAKDREPFNQFGQPQQGPTIEELMGDVDDKSKKIAESLTNNVGGAIDELFSSGKLSGKNFAESVLRDLLRITAQLYVMKPLIESMFGAGGGSSNFGKALFSAFGFNTGGSFTVGGAPGPDANFVPLKLTRGERVDITPAGQSRGGGAPTVIINEAPGVRSDVSSRQDSDGNWVTLIQQIARQTISSDIANGDGAARVLESKYGLRR